MAEKRYDFDLVVIGSGPSGSIAALTAAREGKHVAIIEADAFGGESANWSDVPIKALTHSANLFRQSKESETFGLRTSSISYNYPSIRAWKDLAVRRTGAAGSRSYYEKHGIVALTGVAHFLTPGEITVNRRHISARRFLIATGSNWVTPTDIPGLVDTPHYTPRTILDVSRPPKSLVILGGGKEALEIAGLLNTFGTKVTVVESARTILPSLDEDVSGALRKSLESQGIKMLTATKTLAIQKEVSLKRVTLENGGVESTLRVDEILVALKRLPNTDLGLDNAGVKYTEAGIDVNSHLQTHAKHIYAAGDVINRGDISQNGTWPSLLEGNVVANNMFHRNQLTPNYRGHTDVIWTYPEVAFTGANESSLRHKKVHFKTAVTELNIITRSNTSDFSEGLVKIITDKNGIVIGGAVVGPHASEIIHEISLAVRHNLSARTLAETPHAFLSWSEAVRVAASKLS